MTVAIVTVQDSAWPPRVITETTGLTIGDVVTIYRVIGGQRTVIRGADSITVGDTALVVSDGEYPFGTPVSYTLNVNGADVATAGPTTYSLPGGKVALCDTITGLSAEVVISAWPSKDNPRQGTQFVVGGRNVAVLSPRGGVQATVEFLTESDTSSGQMDALLNMCTSGIILMRQPGGYGRVDGYFAVMGDSEARYVQRGDDERRLWTLDLLEVDPWPLTLLASGWTLADIQTVYAGGTLADLAGDFGTLLDIEVFDWGIAL